MFYFLIITTLILVMCKILTVYTNFKCTANTCLVGKVAIVTGGNSGIGFETVLNLASRGCKVIIADITDGEDTVAKIKEETDNQNIIWKYVDLGSLASVREFAANIFKTESKLDLLINNAGTAGFNGFTKDGLQKTMQINYFGLFLLTHLLVDLLKKTEKSRVISISSILAFTNNLSTTKQMNMDVEIGIKLFKLQFTYGNSKLCVLIAMKVMAEKLKKHGISCYSVHPGLTHTTLYKKCLANSKMRNFSQVAYLAIGRAFVYIFGKNIRETAQTTLHCALSKDVEDLPGKYFCNGGVFWEPPIAYNRKFCLQLWEESEELVKLTAEEKLK